jgi:hypothetical protein
MLKVMWRTLMVVLVVAVVVVLPGATAGACLFDMVRLEDALDPSYEGDTRAGVVGVVERRTIEAAPYLGLSAPRSISAIERSWGQLPADTAPKVDRGGCGPTRCSKDTRTFFVVHEDGSTKRV